MPKKEPKKYFQYEFATANPDFFENKTICFYFDKIDDTHFRIKLRHGEDVIELLETIDSSFSDDDKLLYNKAIKELMKLLQVIIVKKD